MPGSATLATAVVVVADAIWLWRVLNKRLSTADLAVGAANIGPAIGMLILAGRGTGSYDVVLIYEALWIAYYSGSQYRWTAPRRGPAFNHSASRPAARTIGLVALLGTVFNFAVGGVPLLASNVARQKYDVVAAGYGGIPSRLYLYGLPIAFFCAIVTSTPGKRLRRDRLVMATAAALILGGLLSGNKGGVVVALIVMLIGVIGRGDDVRLRRLVWRGLPIAGACVVVVFAVAATYAPYRQSGQSLTTILANRIGVVAAQPATIVMNQQLPQSDPSPTVSDAKYYLHEYFGIGAGAPFTLDRLTSAAILNEPTTASFLPPVTIGAPAELYDDFGGVVGVLVLFALSIMSSTLLRRGFTRLWPKVASIVFAWFLVLIMQRGDIAYYAINLSAVGALLTVVGLVSLLASPRSGRRRFYPEVSSAPTSRQRVRSIDRRPRRERLPR